MSSIGAGGIYFLLLLIDLLRPRWYLNLTGEEIFIAPNLDETVKREGKERLAFWGFP